MCVRIWLRITRVLSALASARPPARPCVCVFVLVCARLCVCACARLRVLRCVLQVAAEAVRLCDFAEQILEELCLRHNKAHLHVSPPGNEMHAVRAVLARAVECLYEYSEWSAVLIRYQCRRVMVRK